MKILIQTVNCSNYSYLKILRFPVRRRCCRGRGSAPWRQGYIFCRKFLELITQKDAILRPFSPFFLCNFPSFVFPPFNFSPQILILHFFPRRPLPPPPLNIVFCIIYIPAWRWPAGCALAHSSRPKIVVVSTSSYKTVPTLDKYLWGT